VFVRKTHMPTKLTNEIITAAVAGFESQKARIDAQIAELIPLCLEILRRDAFQGGAE